MSSLLEAKLREFIFVHVSVMMERCKETNINIFQSPLMIADLQRFPLCLYVAA